MERTGNDSTLLFCLSSNQSNKSMLSFLSGVHFLKFALVYWTPKQLDKNVIEWKSKKARIANQKKTHFKFFL